MERWTFIPDSLIAHHPFPTSTDPARTALVLPMPELLHPAPAQYFHSIPYSCRSSCTPLLALGLRTCSPPHCDLDEIPFVSFSLIDFFPIATPSTHTTCSVHESLRLSSTQLTTSPTHPLLLPCSPPPRQLKRIVSSVSLTSFAIPH